MRVRRAMVFNRPLRTGDDTGWFANQDEAGTPYDVSAYDNDGEYFRALGGTAFEENLADLDLYRRSFTLGDDGWLTAELAARDTTGYHYNQTAEEYDGRHNADWSYAEGAYVDEDIWPAGSAYPDYFLIGIPHTNFYEGSAHIDDVRLYVPRS